MKCELLGEGLTRFGLLEYLAVKSMPSQGIWHCLMPLNKSVQYLRCYLFLLCLSIFQTWPNHILPLGSDYTPSNYGVTGSIMVFQSCWVCAFEVLIIWHKDSTYELHSANFCEIQSENSPCNYSILFLFTARLITIPGWTLAFVQLHFLFHFCGAGG